MDMALTTDRHASAPLPNPPFVFPVPVEKPSDQGQHENSLSKAEIASSRRPRPQQLSLNALPAFDFSPAASSPIAHSPSPKPSPTRRTPPFHGHRRNGSGFVGGDILHGGPVFVSPSPTRSDHSSGHRRNGSELVSGDFTTENPVLAVTSPVASEETPTMDLSLRVGSAATKHGHAHRRSGAISSHDLSMILKPASQTIGGSAPTTPSDSMFRPIRPSKLERSTSQPATATSSHHPMIASTLREQLNIDGQPRSRVGFSNTVEIIPRPLSIISTDTSSSMSTVCVSHSVTNSITSIVGSNASSIPTSTPARPGRTASLEQGLSRSRPSTAGTTSCRSDESDWNVSDSGSIMKRPTSAPSGDYAKTAAEDPCSPSPWGVFSSATEQVYHDSVSGLASAVGSHNQVHPVFQSEASNIHFPPRPRKSSSDSPIVRPRTSPEPKVTKRQRKVRSWAGLLNRKAKHTESLKQPTNHRSPIPPIRNTTPEAEFSLDDVDFDDDTTCIIETASPYPPRTLGTNDNSPGSLKPLETGLLSDTEEMSSSILDIDAALVSNDMPSTGPSFEDVVGNTAGAKRRMHSSGTTGGFAGPGMHYHRRTESAPELDVVDRSRFGFPRLGSNPTMAIEEEEEEEDTSPQEDTTIPSIRTEEQDEYQASGLGVNIIEAESLRDEPMRRPLRRTAKNGQKDHRSSRAFNDNMLEEYTSVEVVDANEEPRFSVVTKSSDESTITPTLSHDALANRPASAPIDCVVPSPSLSYGASETPSAISSPDFIRTSFDAPRIHTATSSINDRATINSSRTGENVLGLQSSVDDVPSLTSSASTMASNHPPRFSSSENTCSSADRSLSLSAAVPARTRPSSASKRSSLASLSRLVGSSYNKSKLNIEESAAPDFVERPEKKKGNRISRMMKFWKSKEKLSS